jgi:hypothetical protein
MRRGNHCIHTGISYAVTKEGWYLPLSVPTSSTSESTILSIGIITAHRFYIYPFPISLVIRSQRGSHTASEYHLRGIRLPVCDGLQTYFADLVRLSKPYPIGLPTSIPSWYQVVTKAMFLQETTRILEEWDQTFPSLRCRVAQTQCEGKEETGLKMIAPMVSVIIGKMIPHSDLR